MINRTDLKYVTNDIKASRLAAIIPFANCRSVDLYKNLIDLLQSSDENSIYSEITLEALVHILQVGVSQLIFFNNDERSKLKNHVLRVWQNMQKLFDELLSLDQTTLQYYYLKILTYLVDFAVTLKVNEIHT